MIHHLRRDALALIAISAAIVAAIVLSLHASWQQRLADDRQLTEGVVRSLVIRLERDLMGAEQGLNELVAALQAEPGRLRPDDPDLERLVATMRRFNPSVAAFGVMRADGRIVASSTPGQTADPTLRPTANFMADYDDPATDRVRVSNPYTRQPDGVQLFALTTPVRDPSGRLTGVAYAAFPVIGVLTTLEPLMSKHAPRVVLVNEKFRVIVARSDEFVGQDLTHSPVFGSITPTRRSGTLETTSILDGRDSMIAFEVSERFGFVAISIKNRAALLDAWFAENRAQIVMLTILPLIGMALAIALVIAHRRRAHAERALAVQAESRLQKGMGSIRDGFCIWDQNRELIFWNRRYAEIMWYLGEPLHVGLRFGDMIRRGAAVLFPDLDADAREAWCRSREAALGRSDGTPREFTTPAGRLIEVADLRTIDGDVVTNLRDVTEERRSRRDIAESEARFRDGIESMADGFMLWDAEDRLVTWNQRAIELLPHVDGLAVAGKLFVDYVSEAILRARPDWTAAQRAAWLKTRLDTRLRNEPHEVSLANGHTIEVVERMTSQGGRVTIQRDITNRRMEQVATERALQAERETNAQQRRFVSVASHEFRTPLAIIDGAVQRIIARRGRETEEELQKRLKRIRDAVTRMTGIIDITLSSARLDDGQIKPEPKSFDLADLLHEVVGRQRAITPSFQISLALPAGGLLLCADRLLLDQVFTNLLSNAAKYSPRAHKVDVAVTIAGERLEIAIRDYGVGIPADELPKLFTRFFRARTAAGIQGTGIGLHLVHELVTLHGGTIDVQSETGAGSTFTVRLPRKLPSLSAAAD